MYTAAQTVFLHGKHVFQSISRRNQNQRLIGRLLRAAAPHHLQNSLPVAVTPVPFRQVNGSGVIQHLRQLGFSCTLSVLKRESTRL